MHHANMPCMFNFIDLSLEYSLYLKNIIFFYYVLWIHFCLILIISIYN